LQRIYLDEILPQNQPSALNLLGMIISHTSKAIEIAKDLLPQPFFNQKEREFLLSSIETILVYKLRGVPCEEIRKIINLAYQYQLVSGR
jgi:predicted transposase YdaD